jgi:hypothetical protein
LTVEDLLFYIIIAAFAYLVLRQLSENWRVKVKSQNILLRNQSLGIGNEIQAQLNALPRVIKELHEMKLKMQGEGATVQMLKPLQQQIWLAEQAQKWAPVIRFATPILNRISTRAVDKGMKFIEQLVTG